MSSHLDIANYPRVLLLMNLHSALIAVLMSPGNAGCQQLTEPTGHHIVTDHQI